MTPKRVSQRHVKYSVLPTDPDTLSVILKILHSTAPDYGLFLEKINEISHSGNIEAPSIKIWLEWLSGDPSFGYLPTELIKKFSENHHLIELPPGRDLVSYAGDKPFTGKRFCVVCGKPLAGKNTRKKTCMGACRTRLWRLRKEFSGFLGGDLGEHLH